MTISGITGSLSQNGGKLTFDDKALAFDVMADGLVSPVFSFFAPGGTTL